VNTAQALEAMSDRGEFELLATSILRKQCPDYAAIIHLGINSKMETVKSRLDGFCRVPGTDPPRFVMVQHTTTDRRGLQGKWLRKSDSKTTHAARQFLGEGDLVKAGRSAQEIRAELPEAKFAVVLATNQRIDEALQLEVYDRAQQFGVDCDIWEQTRLTDYLDNTSLGHWLRKKHLGIEAEMLSLPLLRTLCDRSLEMYEKFLQPITEPQAWISRDIEEHIGKGRAGAKYSIQFLVGPSGSGKGVLSYNALQKHLQSGGLGLWIEAQLLEGCLTLENAIEKVLNSLHSLPITDAGSATINLIPKGERLLLVIDDISRADTAGYLVNNLQRWSRPRDAGAHDVGSTMGTPLILCPLWPQFLGVDAQPPNKPNWVDVTRVGNLSETEGTAAVLACARLADRRLTKLEAKSLATRLGNEAILIGLFGSLVAGCEQGNKRVDDPGEVISRFVARSLTSAQDGSDYLQADFRAALSSLSSFMLRSRRLYPRWREVVEWLGDSPHIDVLRVLIKQGHMCWLTEDGGERLVFRHDRIRDALLAESLKTLMLESDPDGDLLGEPFYAELIGRALVTMASPTSQLMKKIGDLNPLALFEAIRILGPAISADHAKIIREAKRRADTILEEPGVHSSVMSAICWSLADTDSPVVIEITRGFPRYPIVNIARVRNGCVESGAYECIRSGHLAPSYVDELRDQTLAHAKERHGEIFLSSLKEILESPMTDDRLRRGALSLASFFAFTELGSSIARSWELAADKTAMLAEAIWCVTQCCGSEPAELMEPIMTHWETLCGDGDRYTESFRSGGIEQELQWAIARAPRDSVVKYLVDQASRQSPLQPVLRFILEAIDSPDAIEYVVRQASQARSREADGYGISPWLLILPHKWDVNLGGTRKLSDASMDRLLSLWRCANGDDALKYEAFRFWETGVEGKHLEVLKAIREGSILFERALAKRAILRDKEVVPHLLTRLSPSQPQSNVSYWFQFADKVWCDELRALAEEHLDSFRNNIPTDFAGGNLNVHYALARLLREIPARDAERLLKEYWEHLRYSPQFLQTAFCIGSSDCVRLAAGSIKESPADIPVSQHFFFNCTFALEKLPSNQGLERLKNLMPLAERFDQYGLGRAAEMFERWGEPECTQQYLAERLDEKDRHRYCPSDDALLGDLSKFASEPHGELRIRFWLENCDSRGDPKERIMRILDRWLSSNANLRGLQIVAKCLRLKATREHLALLDKYNIAGPEDQVLSLKRNVRFAVCRNSLE
jgi:hypothetical protein